MTYQNNFKIKYRTYIRYINILAFLMAFFGIVFFALLNINMLFFIPYCIIVLATCYVFRKHLLTKHKTKNHGFDDLIEISLAR